MSAPRPLRSLLTDVESHFAFGENWSDFAKGVGERQIQQACQNLWRLVPKSELAGRTFLDIGSGSGLAALAAVLSGCAHVTAVDIDPESVATTRAMLGVRAAPGSFSCRSASVFDLRPDGAGSFDIVYSWGVLHHTGDMWRALQQAADLVRPEGLLVIAIYRKTPFCGLWRREKRLYAAASPMVRAILSAAYRAVFIVGLLVTAQNPFRYARDYCKNRGMNWSHDVHDWLGGYPYESASTDEVIACAADEGFRLVRKFDKPAATKGMLGSHCDEFVFKKL